MSSTNGKRVASFLSAAAVAKGKAVKFGADFKHVVVGAANTDKCIGILQAATTAAEDVAEVALPGGGALALLGETAVPGSYLVSHTDGTLVLANADGDVVVAIAMEGGDAGELIAVEVVHFKAHAAD